MNVLEIEFHGGVLHLNGRPAGEWVSEVYRLREENFRLAAGQCTSALLEQAVKSGDPNGLPALAEWAALVHGIAEITHIFNHLEPDVIVAAQQAAKTCIESQGDEATPLH